MHVALIVRLGVVIALLVVPLTAGCITVASGYGIGPDDDGTTKSVAVGSELRLTLPADRDWNLESTDTSALPLRSAQVGVINGQSYRVWLVDIKKAGDFTLRATGQAACARATPPCADAPTRYVFKIHAV